MTKQRLTRLLVLLVTLLTLLPSLAEARGGGSWTSWARRPWIPRDLPGVTLWVQGDVGTTIATGVSVWADQSLKGHNLSQGIAGKQPSLISSAINGHKAIRFDGVDDFLQGSFTLTQPETVFLVYKSIALGAINNNDIVFDGAVSSTMIFLSCSNAGLRTILSAGTSLTYDVNVANGSYDFITATYNGVSGNLRVHGASVVSGDVGAGNAGGFTIGSLQPGNRPTNIEVEEIVIVAGAVTAADAIVAESYEKIRNGL